MDWSRTRGVKNQRGKTINRINKKQIKNAEIFFEFVILWNQLYTGVKINAKRIPKTIDNKIGFNKKKVNTIKADKIMMVITFLKYSSSILLVRSSLNLKRFVIKKV